ncbi:MAG TPA: hypothetical protein VJO13_03140, partial [Ktedonobacterales bacterium]|nr:hypothetical protein [Ktedonobacterales bacterium]
PTRSERLGSKQEQLAALLAIPLCLVIVPISARTLFPGLAQAAIGSPAWHAEIHFAALLFLCVGIAVVSTRIIVTRGERWKYRIASFLGGVFVIGGLGMQAALLGFDFSRTDYESVALVCTLVLISGFSLWANRSNPSQQVQQ